MSIIREYAEAHGFVIVGKLVRKVEKRERYNFLTGEFELKSTVFWEDEAGNTYTPNCIVTVEGDVI